MPNLYYRDVMRRENPFLIVLTWAIQTIEGPSRLLLSVFVKKDFGERYFNIVSALLMSFVLLIPFLGYVMGLHNSDPSLAWIGFFNFSWLLFVGVFIFVSFKHHKDQGFKLTEYDFDKFSQYQGTDIIPWKSLLKRLNLNPKLTPILIETVLEPLLFFTIGIVLMIVPYTRAVGLILIINSIIYGLSYLAAYWKARHFMLEKNDEIILNKDMARVLMGDTNIPDLPENTRIQKPPILPKTKERGKAIYNQIVVETIGVQ